MAKIEDVEAKNPLGAIAIIRESFQNWGLQVKYNTTAIKMKQVCERAHTSTAYWLSVQQTSNEPLIWKKFLTHRKISEALGKTWLLGLKI